METTETNIHLNEIKQKATTAIIVSSDEASSKNLSTVLSNFDLQMTVEEVTVDKLLEYIAEGYDFHLAIIDWDTISKNSPTLIKELALLENDPAIVLVTSSHNPRQIAKMMEAGVNRVVIKGEAWDQDLRISIKQALRIRKLEEQNQNLITSLVEAKEKVEEKNKRLDEFSSTVAHDIRGLLATIIMRIDYVLETDGKNLTTSTKEMLKKAFETGERLTEIVQATYDFARLGREAVVQREINLDELLNDVISDMNLKAGDNISIEFKNLPSVWGNKGLLRRVFTNLISNSIKYTNKKNILIKVKALDAFILNGRKFIKINVEDNGIGIEQEKINRIFGIFWQDPDASIKYEGLGVGLAVVQRIVELHDGEVSVESEPGEFTRFTLTLPTTK